MSDVLTSETLSIIIGNFASVMLTNADYLNRLDATIGDGDHGRNMSRGFQSVGKQLQTISPTMPDLLLRSTGLTLVSTVSGASGPLYGAAFMAAGIAARSKPFLTLTDLAEITQAATEALARRGRCRLGDKTILDALAPAAQALTQSAENQLGLLVGLQSAAEAARQGMLATIPMLARQGLALQYGEASIGHQDPGATSCYLMFDSAWRSFRDLYI